MNVGFKPTWGVQMRRRTATGLPVALSRRNNPVLRPRDAADVYVNPREEFRRLVDNGVLYGLGRGYYAVVPRDRIGGGWRPSSEAAALAIAQCDYGVNGVALMGLSAARVHGAIPRAWAVGVVAVPRQRDPHRTDFAPIVFVKRDVSVLDVEATRTELVQGWVTTAEQTFVDIAARPFLGGLDRVQADEALRSLAGRGDRDRVMALARRQRKVAAVRAAFGALDGA